MVKEDKLEKVISICHKRIATPEEILDGCSGVCRVVLGTKNEKATKGYLSCSITQEGNNLALCLWKEKEEGKFEKIEHLVMPLADMLTLQGHVNLAIDLATQSGREILKP